jgi:hypothetical protein
LKLVGVGAIALRDDGKPSPGKGRGDASNAMGFFMRFMEDMEDMDWLIIPALPPNSTVRERVWREDVGI